MSEELIWDDESATYIRLRQNRYPGAIGIQPAWTQEVMADADLGRVSKVVSDEGVAAGVSVLTVGGLPG